MKKVLDKLISPQAFALAYLPWLAVYMVSVVNILPITRVVLAGYAAWAAVVCVRMYVLGGKSAWTHKGMALLIGFLAACLLTQALGFAYGGFAALGRLCYFALCILVVYSQHGCGVSDYYPLLRRAAVVLTVVITVLMLVSDWMFLTMYSATVTVRSGVMANVGFAENRLFGVFTSPNVGGTFALILIWCCVLLIRLARDMRGKVAWRVLAAVGIAAAMMYISVSLSRGTYVSAAVLVAAWMMVRPALRRERPLAVWKQAIIRVASAGAALVLCAAAVGAVNRVSCAMLEWNYHRGAASEASAPATAAAPMRLTAGMTALAADAADIRPVIDDATAQQIIDNAHLGFDGRVEVGDTDISNNRFRIWRDHLSLLEGKYLFIGINQPPAYLTSRQAAGEVFTDEQVTTVTYAGGNLHNGYLQMLVNGGLVTLLPMAAFLLWCAVRALRYAGGALLTRRRPVDSRAYALFSVTLPMILAILANNVFETNFVLMGANFIGAFFWLIAGACVQSIREGVEEV